MLDNHAEANIKLIGELANKVWGDNCEIGEVKITNSPFPEFKLPMRLYHKVDVILTYDRSILGIALKTAGGNKWVDDLTSQIIYDGFESCKPENLLHNLQVLDEVVCDMSKREA